MCRVCSKRNTREKRSSREFRDNDSLLRSRTDEQNTTDTLEKLRSPRLETPLQSKDIQELTKNFKEDQIRELKMCFSKVCSLCVCVILDGTDGIRSYCLLNHSLWRLC